MEGFRSVTAAASFFFIAAVSGWLFWRYVWFFRNPRRSIPEKEGILSPADGTVVYVRSVPPSVPVISIKKDRPVTLKDIVKADIAEEKILVGVFMSPFDVHYNRCPVSGMVDFVQHYPALTHNYHMGSMHWRAILKRVPLYRNSRHIVHNERTVTKILGEYKDLTVSCYVVQIAGGSVRGIESRVKPGDRVKAGETLLIV